MTGPSSGSALSACSALLAHAFTHEAGFQHGAGFVFVGDKARQQLLHGNHYPALR